VVTGLQDGCGAISHDLDTFDYVRALEITAGFATDLGFAADAAYYGGLATTVRGLYNTVYYNAAAGTYAAGQPINQIMAITLGVVPPAGAAAVFANLVHGVTNGSYAPLHNTGGIITTKYLWPALTAGGRTDIAMAMLLQTTQPSYGAWLADGATTAWENWPRWVVMKECAWAEGG
jgi:alpha-L-rhamnosidase